MLGLVVCSMMWCQPEWEVEIVVGIEMIVVAEEDRVRIWSCGVWGECGGGFVHVERKGRVLGMVCKWWIVCVEEPVDVVGHRVAVEPAEVFGT